jgi:acyl dehydratase
MAGHVMLTPPDLKMGVNYGFGRVRFIAPVRAGKRVRGRFVLANLEEKRPGQLQFVHQVTVEIEDEDKPALIADWIGQVFV